MLDYCPETGLFTRRVTVPRGKAGKRPGSQYAKSGYRRINLDNVSYREHQLAWYYVHGIWPTNNIDHINGKRDDNRIANLRDIPFGENLRNRTKVLSSTGLMGAVRVKDRFQAQIRINGKPKYLGLFDTAEEASAAYWMARKQRDGEIE